MITTKKQNVTDRSDATIAYEAMHVERTVIEIAVKRRLHYKLVNTRKR